MSTRAAFCPDRLRLVPILGLLVACASLLGAAPAGAAPVERDRQAGQMFYEGKYEEALKIYIELAFETKRPEYMCNIGRCYARLGRIDEAIHNMRDCLAQAPLDPRKRAEYETHVRALEAQRAQGAAGRVAGGAVIPAPGAAPVPPPQPGTPGPAAPAPNAASVAAPAATPPWPPGAATAPGGQPAPAYGAQPPHGQPGYYPPGSPPSPYPPVATAPTAAAPLTAAPAPAAPVAESRAKAKKKRRLLPFASYVTGAVGLVGITAGVAFGLQSKGIYDDLAVRFDPEREREAKRANTAQIVSYSVGGAALVAAVIIAVVSERPSDGKGPGAVALAADGAAAGWSWRF